jgi:hypothetical protein
LVYGTLLRTSKKEDPVKFHLLLWVGLAFSPSLWAAEGPAPLAPRTNATALPWTEDEIQATYALLADYHARYLAPRGVKLPELRRADGQYTQTALTLVLLAQGYPDTKTVSKSELTEFMRTFYPQVNDVQQARHLAAQQGWYILSGTRNDDPSVEIPPGEYKLVSLEEAYPGYTDQRRAGAIGPLDWEQVKTAYGYRCACCGSKEGEPHLRWPETATRLQKGHMDPARPLEPGNIIPQCQFCNQASRNFWIYDDKGHVVAVANPAIVDRSPEAVQRQIYERLHRKFGGKDPRLGPIAD